MDSFFNGPIIPTIGKLVAVSFVAGLVFYVLGIDPAELWLDLGGTIRRIWEMALDTVQWGAKYVFMGAIVVVPIWIIYRLIQLATGGGKRPG